MDRIERTLVTRIVAEIHFSAPTKMQSTLLKKLNDEVMRLVDSVQTRTQISMKAMQRMVGPDFSFDYVVEEPIGKPWEKG